MTTLPAVPVDPTAPCDTRMMGIVHSALRRDLVRCRMALEDPGWLTDDRRAGLADHVLWMMHLLHLHHRGEDTGLYPMVLRNDPDARPLLEEMDADHQRIDGAMDQLQAAARTFSAAAPGSQDGLLAAVGSLEEVLLPHLAREELVMMPVVSGCVSQREWDDWNEQVNVKPKGLMLLAEEGHWILDNLDDEGRAQVVALVPPVPRFVLIRLLGGRYRRKRALLWDGTPAATVPSMSLEIAPDWR